MHQSQVDNGHVKPEDSKSPPPSPLSVQTQQTPPPVDGTSASRARAPIAPTASELVSIFQRSLMSRTDALSNQLQSPSGAGGRDGEGNGDNGNTDGSESASGFIGGSGGDDTSK